MWEIVALDKATRKKLAAFKFKKLACHMPRDLDQIAKDIRRTAAPRELDPRRLPDFYNAVENVLIAFCNARPDVGYMQGMNVIVSCLLYNLVAGDFGNIPRYEESAFRLLFALMGRYGAEGFFRGDMRQVFEFAAGVELALQTGQPDLLAHIRLDEVGSAVLGVHLLQQSGVQPRPARPAPQLFGPVAGPDFFVLAKKLVWGF